MAVLKEHQFPQALAGYETWVLERELIPSNIRKEDTRSAGISSKCGSPRKVRLIRSALHWRRRVTSICSKVTPTRYIGLKRLMSARTTAVNHRANIAGGIDL